MKNSLKQVNFDSSITIVKSKLVKIFIVIILNLWYTENIKMERKNQKIAVDLILMSQHDRYGQWEQVYTERY